MSHDWYVIEFGTSLGDSILNNEDVMSIPLTVSPPRVSE